MTKPGNIFLQFDVDYERSVFLLFDAIVRPILTYGSDVWGVNTAGGEAVDNI